MYTCDGGLGPNFELGEFNFGVDWKNPFVSVKRSDEVALTGLLILLAIPLGIAWCCFKVSNFMKSIIHKRRPTNEAIVQKAQE